MDLEQDILQDPILAMKYDFVQKLGEGCFGKIYKVKNRELKVHTALKLEILDTPNKKSMLQNEADILKTLKGKPFVPQFYSYGQWSMGAFIQIQLLVVDLNSLVQKIFTFDEISTLAAKLFQSLCVLHNSNILHQDIKPQNIMINTKGEYYFIDFGISKKMKQTVSKFQAPNSKKTRGFIGTPRYASIQAHKGLDQSKRDDLQSLMYNIAYLYFKKLPWLSLKVAGNRKIEQIKNTKMKTAQGVFQQMGKPFFMAFNYIRKLNHTQQPNYKYLISIFKRSHTMIIDSGAKNDPDTNLDQKQNVKVKRYQGKKKLSLNPSLNYGKYLELPFMTKEGISESTHSSKRKLTGDYTFASSLHLTGGSMNGSKAISIRAYNEVDQITGGEGEDGQEEDDDVDLKEEEDLEPCVPDISKFFCPITMKNPFSVVN